MIYRFASTANPNTGMPIPAEKWARGPWWFFEAGYRLIRFRHAQGQLNLGTVAQIAGAVQPTWSQMDVQVTALVIKKIPVYVGKGKTQHRELLPNGMYMTLKGWPDIEQIYIPKIRGDAFASLQILHQEFINDRGIAIGRA